MLNLIKKVQFNHIRNALFLVLALSIFLFNVTFKTNLNAVGSDIVINAENLFRKHNQVRTDMGINTLSFSTTLSNSATLKAKAMVAADCWSHYCPNGKSPWDFFDEAGYVYIFAGENLAEGFYNVNTLMDTWMNSPTHRSNIVNENYNEIGFGIVGGQYQNNDNNLLIVVHFGKRDLIINEPFIKISSPLNSEEIDTSSFDVSGSVRDIQEVNINLDDSIKVKGQINEGEFTVRLNNVVDGAHKITASGVDSFNNPIQSNEINVTVDTLKETVIPINNSNSQSLGVTISPDVKNVINIFFIVVIAGIFLLDILVLSRTTTLKDNRSFSHYHFILLLVTGFAIAIGNYGGRVINGTGV